MATSSHSYDAEHSVCPKCKSYFVVVTCRGHIVSDWSTHVNDNKATCEHCHWKGIVHDLVPDPLHGN